MEDWESSKPAEKTENSIMPQCFIFEHVSLASLHSFLHVKQHQLPLTTSLFYLLQVMLVDKELFTARSRSLRL